MNRRAAIKTAAIGASAAFVPLAYSNEGNAPKNAPLKGNIRHSVCSWCYPDLSLDELCLLAKDIGLVGIDLIGPEGWPTLKKHGLISTMCNGAELSLTEGFNHIEYHPQLIENYTRQIELVAAAGYTNLICFSGNRNGMDDETVSKLSQLKQILPLAEEKGVVIQMELFNSKVDHPDYMCDNTAWGIELCKRLDSPNFKLLYDIYHMQIEKEISFER